MFLIIAAFATLPCVSNASERIALELMYEALSGSQWRNSAGWLSDAPLGEWHGVSTRDGRVIRIELPNNNLIGQLPSDLKALEALEILDLRWNNISGTIPEDFGEMKRLESFLLSGNELSGRIPWQIGSMQKLKRLDLSYNQLRGDVPSELRHLQSLQSLGLQHNQLTGPVPQELNKIRSLRRVILNHNSLVIPFGIEGKFPGIYLQANNNGSKINNFLTSNNAPSNSILMERIFSSNGEVNGLNMLEETTLYFQNSEHYDSIHKIMSAIFVRNGFLQIEPSNLDNTDIDFLKEVIQGINDDLRKTGDRIYSVNDLEMYFELYDGFKMNIANNLSSYISESPLNQSSYGFVSTGISSRKQGASASSIAWIICPGTKAHNAHQSTTNRTEITGKSTVICKYAQGPSQSITYEAFNYVQRLHKWWIFYYWKDIGKHGHAARVGYNIKIEQPDLVAVAPCVNGTYRTKLRLFISGSVSGIFVPYPGYFYSTARSVSC